MSVIKRAATFVFSIYGFAVFLLLMFLLLPFFLIAFSLPRPTNGNMVYKISYVWARLFFIFTAIRYREVSENRPSESSSYIFVTNHISYLDIPMMILATKRFPVRILGKAEMTKIPVFGWIYRAGAVTVKRESQQARKESLAELKAFLQEKISILLCPEGTFNMTEKPLKDFYNGAFKLAIELQKPIIPIVFPDTYNRMNYRSIFSLTPGLCRAVFLPAIPAAGHSEDEVSPLRDRVYDVMEQELLKLNAPWIGEAVK